MRETKSGKDSGIFEKAGNKRGNDRIYGVCQCTIVGLIGDFCIFLDKVPSFVSDGGDFCMFLVKVPSFVSDRGDFYIFLDKVPGTAQSIDSIISTQSF